MDIRRASQSTSATEFPQVAVIALSNHESQEMVQAMTEAGGSVYLTKDTVSSSLNPVQLPRASKLAECRLSERVVTCEGRVTRERRLFICIWQCSHRIKSPTNRTKFNDTYFVTLHPCSHVFSALAFRGGIVHIARPAVGRLGRWIHI